MGAFSPSERIREKLYALLKLPDFFFIADKRRSAPNSLSKVGLIFFFLLRQIDGVSGKKNGARSGIDRAGGDLGLFFSGVTMASAILDQFSLIDRFINFDKTSYRRTN
jgi:hypothetical protein